MKSRITLALTDDGQLEIFLNEAGREELVDLLQSLDREDEHFHFAPVDQDMDCGVSEIPYRKTDRILSHGKVLFRPDDWDSKYYPHVMDKKN